MLHTLNVDVKVIIYNHPTCSIIDCNTLVTHNYVCSYNIQATHTCTVVPHQRNMGQGISQTQRMVFIA